VIACDKFTSEDGLRYNHRSSIVPGQNDIKYWITNNHTTDKFMIYRTSMGVVNNNFTENSAG